MPSPENTLPTIVCPRPLPRDASQGIDTLEVSRDQRLLTVTLLRDVAAGSGLYDAGRYLLTGGRRLHPRVVKVSAGGAANELVLQLDQPGDFSIYTLTVNGPDIDPFFASRRFSFKIECENPFDCKPSAPPPSPEKQSPAIDYLTKDYAGFRQLLLDMIPARLPDWTERSEADIGIVLLEALAEAADRLSYMQDRVANEAWLGTATQRRSVQLHTALIGYRMRPGANARTWLYFNALTDTLISAGTQVRTITEGNETPVIFETGPGDFMVRPRCNAMIPYDWGNRQCCLPSGATEAAVVGDYTQLRMGDSLLIADVADPERREIVQLAADPVLVFRDAIKAHPTESLTLFRWGQTQALRFEYCLQDLRTVIRANLVPADHGKTIGDELLGEADESLRRLRFVLHRAPLTYVPDDRNESPAATVSTLAVTVDGEQWQERETLIDSGPFDPHYRVELDDEGYGTVVFGDGRLGRKPATGSTIAARYRIGIGPSGNVGRDTLVILPASCPGVESVTNPLAATGGAAPETKDEARRTAPLVIQTPVRCVTEADYERAATEYRKEGVLQVQRARARFVWTGSWHTVFISVDPIGSEELTGELREGLYAWLRERKLAGYDLAITSPNYVPLDVRLRVCVKHNFIASNVGAQLLHVLSNRVNPDGTRGFFHPDNLSFGEPVLLSRLVAAAASVQGVDSVVVTGFCRLHQRFPSQATEENLRTGLLSVADAEIARLDNDPSYPENGRLTLELLGGK